MSSELWMKGLEFLVHPETEPCDQLKLPVALFCLLSARMLLRVLLCLWVLILWIQQSSLRVVGGPCAKPYMLLPRWGGLWEMPVVLFLSVWRVSCPLWSWRKQRWSWYSRYNVGIFKKSVHLCRMVRLSRSPPHCTSSSRSLMVKHYKSWRSASVLWLVLWLQASHLDSQTSLGSFLVRFQHQSLKHGGVNVLLTSLSNQFWIVVARALAMQVKKRCLQCQKQVAAASSQLAAPVLAVLVRPAEPFAVTGVDHAGPLHCCDQPAKKL